MVKMEVHTFVQVRAREHFAIVASTILVACMTMLPPAWAVENGGYPNARFLVSTQWVADHLNDPDVRILDRQDVEPAEEFYAKGHIPNSIRMTTTAIKGMRLSIQEMLLVKDLIRFLEENGVSQDHHVIIVSRSDRFPAATRVFWALDLLGHQKASVLDGGIDKWIAEKRPMTSVAPRFDKTTYKVNLKRDRLMTGDELAGYVGEFKQLDIVAVDSRRPEEHAGTKMSRASGKLGRIPGAVSLFFPAILVGANYKEFKSADEIKKIFDAKGITPDKNAVFSCVSGCFGTVLYLGARLLDYPKVSVYDGGWIEWSQKGYPAEGGESPGISGTTSSQPAKAKPPAQRPAAPDQGC
jgi:thiosulfate/3-mercaptopyruvate sulfurtransferase